MKKYASYFLMITLPAALLITSNLIQAYMNELFERGGISTPERLFYFLTSPLAVAALVLLLLYSVRYAQHRDYRILMGVLTVGYLAFSLYTSSIDSRFIPMEALSRQLLVEDLSKYSGYYAAAFLFAAFSKKK